MKECAYCNRCFEDDLNVCPKDNQPLIDSFPGSCVLDTKYLLETCVGRGGMGAVYRAKHVHLNRPFAIKTVLPEFASRDPQAKERFLQEAQTAAAILHPNVVAITDFGVTSDKLFYYVMEYIEGKSLGDILRTSGAMLPERVYRIFRQVLAGVGAAHRLHMVHRDLKPSNIMLTSITNPQDEFKILIPLNDEPEDNKNSDNEIAKVVDFGLARFVNNPMRNSELQEGGLVGSPLYMSPEQCEESTNVDERSDIYSLGIILFHMLTGEVPFKGTSLSSIISAHLLKNPPSPRSIKPEIPEKLEKVVLKTLAKKPHLRYQSISELAEDFEAAMNIYVMPESQKTNVIVQTVPPACEIYIDDEYRGRTGPEGRLVVKGLAVGTHQARITLKGYLEWAQPFTAASGDFNLTANLQRKEDLEFAAKSAKLASKQPTTRRLPSTPLPSREEGSDIYYRAIPNQAPEISYLDIFVAIVVILTTFSLAAAFNPDPIFDILSQRSNLPLNYPMSLLVTATIVGFVISVTIPNQLPAYRNSVFLGKVFSLTGLLFVLVVIFPLIVGVLFKFVNPEIAPPIPWFIMRVIVIAGGFLLQQRAKSRGKVGFLT